VEGERVCPRLWGHTKKHGVPHASWRWRQGQRPAPPCGTPPRALRRPAAADGGGSGLPPSPRPERCRRRPAAGGRPAGGTASRPARGWGGVRKRGGQPGAGRRWRGCHGKRGFIFPILPPQRHEGFPSCSPERRCLHTSYGAPVYGVSRSCTGVARASTLVPNTSTYRTFGLSHPSSVWT
jgi:hypothetical protein